MYDIEELQTCPYCGGENVSLYENGLFKVLYCSNCEEYYKLHRAKKNDEKVIEENGLTRQ